MLHLDPKKLAHVGIIMDTNGDGTVDLVPENPVRLDLSDTCEQLENVGLSTAQVEAMVGMIHEEARIFSIMNAITRSNNITDRPREE